MNRVSTFGIQNTAIATLINQQAKIARTQQQLSTGLRLTTAADDPVAAGIAVALDRAQAEAIRHGANANLVNNRLTLAEVTLADVGDRVQRLRELAIQANGGIYTQENRRALLAEVRGQYEALLAIANMPDGQGRYLFAGSQDDAVPFLRAPGGASPGPLLPASYTTADLTSFDFSTIPGLPTSSTASGAYTQAASTDPGDAFQLLIDGNVVSDRLTADATDINLDADIAAFIAGSGGLYTATGSIAGGDLVISRTDGADLDIATAFSDGIGSTNPPIGVTSDGTFADPAFVGTHTGGTPPDTSANRSFDVVGPGGSLLSITLDADYTDINGLVAHIQGLPGYATSGVTVAAVGNALQFTAVNPGPGNVYLSGADEFDVGGTRIAGQGAQTTAIVYAGDQTVRQIDIGAGQSIRDVNDGIDIFMRIGAGRTVARADAANQGTGVLQSHAFTDPRAWVPDNYRVVFSEPAPGVIEYEILDGSGTPLGPPTTWAPGDAITFNGFQLTIGGTPAAGDSFRVGPASARSIFQTVEDMIATLEMPDIPAPAKAAQQNAYYALLEDLHTLGDHITDMRASFGARMSLIDKSVDAREAELLSIRTTLSGLRDLNYAEAISRLSQESATLEAAQMSYLRMQSLSLFDRLG